MKIRVLPLLLAALLLVPALASCSDTGTTPDDTTAVQSGSPSGVNTSTFAAFSQSISPLCRYRLSSVFSGSS